MPALNWNAFATLPGSAEKNFELLCRGIIRLNFGSYGVLRGLANQPGVEFHLKLDRHCDALGDSGRWWGWQCKWYDLSEKNLGANRRNKIVEGIRKTEDHVPGITDWVLWTRRTLTSADQKWFKGISSTMTLHLYTADDIDSFLIGQAAVLRSTYFGELVLTPEVMREWHDRAVAPIQARWQPEVHHIVDAERTLRRMLGESGSWDEPRVLAGNLRFMVQQIEDAPKVPEALAPLVAAVIDVSRQSADALDRVAEGIRNGDLELLRDELKSQPHLLATDIAAAPRRLRSANLRAGLYVTNAVAGCRETLRLFTEVKAAFSTRVVAIVAPAGCGKTHLAAQVTAGTQGFPYGVLLHGRDLLANNTLDDLARRVSIAAQPVPSMESLLAAVDAAGQRARHRLPVVIDGLNESEDPRNWKRHIAMMETMLAKYPYVLLVCTLRPEFVGEALPDGTRSVEINDFGNDTIEAIRAHFLHYKIEPCDISIPMELLGHPLTLRLFCEVTNPTRQKFVGIDSMPDSLTALFDLYLKQVGDRIAELSPRTQRYCPQDVRSALTIVANTLWDSRSRSVDIDELRRDLGDVSRPWDQSLVRALEHEGVLLRMPSNGNGAYVPVYDRLGGHIIANTLLAKHGQVGFEQWILNPSTISLLAGDYNDRHPLAEDVLYSLVGQIPRRFYSKQLWQLVDEPLRSRSLRIAARLETSYLDTATVDALLDFVRQGDAELLDLLRELRGVKFHPLNSEALDRVLRPMRVADRDLSWTEWLRRNHDEVVSDLEHLVRRWRHGKIRTGDHLRARWVMWTLTSTVRRMRDQATLALYWFGRSNPKELFELTVDSLGVNDAYVGERMLAATYGVVMSHQQQSTDFEGFLASLLDRLADAFVGSSASAPTHHYLARLYVRGIVAFAENFYTHALPKQLRSQWSFAIPAPLTPILNGDPRATEVERTLHMDFENYTLGRLFDDRANYDMNHQGHQVAVAHVRGVVWSLGWREKTFEMLDRDIANDAYRSGNRLNRSSPERYGKKYGWIGYFTYAGMLDEQGHFAHIKLPISDVDIDPSFPDEPPDDGDSSISQAWLAPNIGNHERWFCKNTTRVPRNLLVRKKIGEQHGPWVAVHGFVEAEDRILGRNAWAFISVLVTPKQNRSGLIAALKFGEQPRVSRQVPSDYYTYAGEIPWHPNFAAEEFAESGSKYAYQENVRVKSGNAKVEVLAHGYEWENYHSEINRAGRALVPSRKFSTRFNLRSTPQRFDQYMPDGTLATITLRGVDGLKGSVLYVREDILQRYVGNRSIVWFAFGERTLRPYPSSPPQWMIDAQIEKTNTWNAVFTESDLKQKISMQAKKNAGKQRAPIPKAAKKKRNLASSKRNHRAREKEL